MTNSKKKSPEITELAPSNPAKLLLLVQMGDRQFSKAPILNNHIQTNYDSIQPKPPTSTHAEQAAQIEGVYEQLDIARSLVQAQVQPLERALAAIGVVQANLQRHRDAMHEVSAELRRATFSPHNILRGGICLRDGEWRSSMQHRKRISGLIALGKFQPAVSQVQSNQNKELTNYGSTISISISISGKPAANPAGTGCGDVR